MGEKVIILKCRLYGMNGGDCKITPLGVLTPIGKSKYRAQYMGRTSTVKITAYLNYSNY